MFTDFLPTLAMALSLGAALGFFGGLFGIGGGIIAIPLLVLAFGMEQPLAQGTALVMMAPNLLIGFWRYCQRQPLSLGSTLSIGLSSTLVTWLVAGFANRLDPALLRLGFSVFLALLGLHMLWRRERPAAAGGSQPGLATLAGVGAVGGCSMGFLGIGGGLLATPLLAGLGVRQVVAQSLALALVAPSSLAALASYAGAGRVDWQMGLPMALGGLMTVSPGVALAHRLPERRMRTAFALMLVLAALWLAVGGSRSH